MVVPGVPNRPKRAREALLMNAAGHYHPGVKKINQCIFNNCSADCFATGTLDIATARDDEDFEYKVVHYRPFCVYHDFVLDYYNFLSPHRSDE